MTVFRVVLVNHPQRTQFKLADRGRDTYPQKLIDTVKLHTAFSSSWDADETKVFMTKNPIHRSDNTYDWGKPLSPSDFGDGTLQQLTGTLPRGFFNDRTEHDISFVIFPRATNVLTNDQAPTENSKRSLVDEPPQIVKRPRRATRTLSNDIVLTKIGMDIPFYDDDDYGAVYLCGTSTGPGSHSNSSSASVRLSSTWLLTVTFTPS